MGVTLPPELDDPNTELTPQLIVEVLRDVAWHFFPQLAPEGAVRSGVLRDPDDQEQVIDPICVLRAPPAGWFRAQRRRARWRSRSATGWVDERVERREDPRASGVGVRRPRTRADQDRRTRFLRESVT